MFNKTQSKNLPNFTRNQLLSDKHSWLIHRFTIVQRSFFILSLVSQLFGKQTSTLGKKNIRLLS